MRLWDAKQIATAAGGWLARSPETRRRVRTE